MISARFIYLLAHSTPIFTYLLAFRSFQSVFAHVCLVFGLLIPIFPVQTGEAPLLGRPSNGKSDTTALWAREGGYFAGFFV